MNKLTRQSHPYPQSASLFDRCTLCALPLSVVMLVSLSVSSIVADEPATSKWNYQSRLLRPFWQGDTIEGESMLFIRDPKTGIAKASVLSPIVDVLSIQNSAGEKTYEEGRDYLWKPGSREITLPAGSRIASYTPADLRRPDDSQKYKLTHRDGNGEIFFGAKLEYHHMQTCITYRHESEDWEAIQSSMSRPCRAPSADCETESLFRSS